MSDHVATISELEALYPGSDNIAAATSSKETPVINDAYPQLIKAAPFLNIASIGPEGMDCSPRGDGPGFAKILDERTSAILDRRGNNRLDTLRNIVADPRLALLFLIPGLNETFRINGRAHLSTKPDLLATIDVDGKLPVSAIVVEIDTMYFQCARAQKRSKPWDLDTQLHPKTLPSAGKLVKSVMDEFDASSYDDALKER